RICAPGAKGSSLLPDRSLFDSRRRSRSRSQKARPFLFDRGEYSEASPKCFGSTETMRLFQSNSLSSRDVRSGEGIPRIDPQRVDKTPQGASWSPMRGAIEATM